MEKRTLTRLEQTLPSHYYYDPAHHQRELEAFWYQSWLCVGRGCELADSGDYRVVHVGDQSVIITRNANGELKAFYNTCRHRGSVLCEHTQGRFTGGRIVCPYHAWTYTLDGKLSKTPWRLESDDFDATTYSLYQVATGEWAGFIFINLAPTPRTTLDEALDDMPELFYNWGLESARGGHRSSRVLQCNWKVFWENYGECYHCPGVHPELCQIVPQYGKGWVSPSDAPEWKQEDDPDAGPEPRLAPGAVTWSDDGKTQLPWFQGLNEAQQNAGHTYGTLLPSCFVVTHVDYVRVVYLLPQGPEQTRLTVDWLFPADTLSNPDIDIGPALKFGQRVVDQDARVCELNQKGLHCDRFEAGVLAPQEYYVRDFQRWVRAGLGESL